MYDIWFSYSKVPQRNEKRESSGRENPFTALYCVCWKTSTYKWGSVYFCVVQRSTVYQLSEHRTVLDPILCPILFPFLS